MVRLKNALVTKSKEMKHSEDILAVDKPKALIGSSLLGMIIKRINLRRVSSVDSR